ncbi:hypothetical protein [Alishewanella longhuensis]
MITQINVTVGQRVKRGDVLALVESNDSLRTYPLKAPIAGIVLQQFASQGEYRLIKPLLRCKKTCWKARCW